jgi:hypothetical protein
LQLYREAEITHCRVAMLASLGFAVGEAVNPLFNGAITGMYPFGAKEVACKTCLKINKTAF